MASSKCSLALKVSSIDLYQPVRICCLNQHIVGASTHYRLHTYHSSMSSVKRCPFLQRILVNQASRTVTEGQLKMNESEK